VSLMWVRAPLTRHDDCIGDDSLWASP
jgi:hypothetical protein